MPMCLVCAERDSTTTTVSWAQQLRAIVKRRRRRAIGVAVLTIMLIAISCSCSLWPIQ
jgi:hypothetical protein